MDQIKTTFSFQEDTILAAGHDPVVLSGKVNADQGELAAGTLLAKSDTDMVIHEEKTETLGTGDGTAVTFTGTVANHPIHPGSLSCTDGTETFSDDGHGTLTGSAGGSGTVNYKTGAISLTFAAAPAAGANIDATCHNLLAGVLEKTVDTATDTSCNYVVHGSVRQDRLKKGAAAAEPAVTDLERLLEAGIYPL